jgi:hypothetical protein
MFFEIGTRVRVTNNLGDVAIGEVHDGYMAINGQHIKICLDKPELGIDDVVVRRSVWLRVNDYNVEVIDE